VTSVIQPNPKLRHILVSEHVMPLKVDAPKKPFPVRRVISGVTLTIFVVAIALALKKPVRIAVPQPKEVTVANAQSFESKVRQLEEARTQGTSGQEVRISGEEVRAALIQSLEAPVAQGAASDVPLQAPDIAFEGDQVKGQFVANVSGKPVYVTVNGRLGAQNGYATFEPTQFKIGDLNVPVSLVNDALQRKMTEQRDKLKLPDFVSNLKIENGELVIQEK
jgi:hypothetical protein